MTRADRGGARRILTLGLGLTGSLLVGLLLCELLARVYERLACVPQSGGINRHDRYYGWGNRRNGRARMCGCVGSKKEYDVDVTTNEAGMRGPTPPPDARRVLVLGDSFTAGMQVADDQVYPRLLEARLNARAGRRVAVLNAGVNGWSTDNELLYWRREGIDWKPELVLLVFDTTNDVFENQRRLVSRYPLWPDKPYARLRNGVLSIENLPIQDLKWSRRLATDTASFLAARSALFRIVAWSEVLPYRVFFLPAPIPPDDAVEGAPYDIFRRDYPEVWTEAWRITRGLVLRLRDEVERHGARFAVVVINSREEVVPPRWDRLREAHPDLAAVPLDRDKPDRVIRRFLARREIATIPLLPAFRDRFSAGGPALFYWLNMHWAPAGHALAAETIADEIARLGLLP